MKPISADAVGEYLDADIRKLGFVTHSLIGEWDAWVRRRVEQIELVSDASAKRRISVDFRLQREAFGDPVIKSGSKWVHYVPLTLLEKAPFANFDLRDESNTAIPLLTRRKTAAIAAATLIAATKMMVVQQLLASGAEAGLAKAIRDGEVSIDQIEIPAEIEANFLNLCYFPYARGVVDAGETTAERIWKGLVLQTLGSKLSPVGEWPWEVSEDTGNWHTSTVSRDSWVQGIFSEPILSSLIFDFTRLFMVCAPVDYEPERRRILKLEYEEHLAEPGLNAFARLRKRVPRQASWIRQREDCLEGLSADQEVSRHEWILPRSAMNSDLSRPKLPEVVARGIGWMTKPVSFKLPSVGLGGTFHLEVNAPDGTQLRRAELRALDDDPKIPGPIVRDAIARRYARNVTRSHLYLGGLRQGTWGHASMAIKPKSSTVIRGAALAASAVTLLVLLALALGGSLSDSSQTVIAILLLAPGLVAAVTGQPFQHSITSKMVFGLRLIALAIASVSVAAAALLSGHLTFCDEPALWTILVLMAAGFTVILLGAWRLAARDWPRQIGP